MLSFRRQLADEPEKRILLFGTDKRCLRMIAFGRQHRNVIDGNFLFAAAVTMPVSDQVVRNAVQPGRKWDAAVCVILNVVHRPLKDASGEIFRVVRVPRPVVHVVEYAVNVLRIKFTKSLTVTLRGARFNTSASLYSSSGTKKPYRRGFANFNPAGFEKLLAVYHAVVPPSLILGSSKPLRPWRRSLRQVLNILMQRLPTSKSRTASAHGFKF